MMLIRLLTDNVHRQSESVEIHVQVLASYNLVLKQFNRVRRYLKKTTTTYC